MVDRTPGRQTNRVKLGLHDLTMLNNEMVAFAALALINRHFDRVSDAYREIARRRASPISKSSVRRHFHDQKRPTSEELRSLDEAIFAVRGVVTYLEAFANERPRIGINEGSDPVIQAALEPRWFPQITSTGPAQNKPNALLRGKAMASWLQSKRNTGRGRIDLSEQVTSEPLPHWVGSQVGGRIVQTVEDLLSVASLPTGQGSQSAAWYAARAGTTAIEAIQRHVDEGSPLWWRTVRVATFAVQFATVEGNVSPNERSQIARRVSIYLEGIHRSNPPNMYRARSLWEDCASVLPAEPDIDDWLIDALIERSVQSDHSDVRGGSDERLSPSACPVRERMTAAIVAYERIKRASEQNPGVRRWDVVRDLVDPLRIASHGGGDTGYSTMESGLSFTADYLEHRLSNGWALFPGREHLESSKQSPLLARTDVAFILGQLESSSVTEIKRDLPGSLQDSTLDLVAAALLACNGIQRRDLLEGLVAAGLSDISARLFFAIASAAQTADNANPGELRWVAEHAVFCMSFMAHEDSVDDLMDIGAPRGDYNPESGRAIRMTALMGLGDLAHALKSDDARRDQIASRMCRSIRGVGRGRGAEGIPLTTPELRGAIYTLAMLRPVDNSDVKTVLQDAANGRTPVWNDRLHERQGHHNDETTIRLARWGLLRIEAREAALRAPAGSQLQGWLISPIDPRVCG